MKTYVVKSDSKDSRFEGTTDRFSRAVAWFDNHNKANYTTVVEEEETGKTLIRGENGNVTYIEPGVLLEMLSRIGKVDPEAGLLLGMLTLLSGVLE